MIVTEEEAKTKMCQEEFGAENAGAVCMGSACMAWRWQHYDDDQLNAGKCVEYVAVPLDDPAPEGDHWTVDLDPDNQTPGHTTYQRPDIPRGYCGKAGKPDRY